MTAPITSRADNETAGSLAPFLSRAGAIRGLALDHRDAMRNAFIRAGRPDVTDAAMLDVKERIADALGDLASATLLDQTAVERCRVNGAGLLVPLEEQGHFDVGGGRLTPLLDGFAPEDAAALGADGCKLLVYYRADHEASSERQRTLVRDVAQECHRHGLVLAAEPLVYRLENEDPQDYARRFNDLVVAAAAELAGTGADLLKLQFPGDAGRCERVTAVAAPVPWTLLGGSDVDGERFCAQLRVACASGASGFIAGRCIWGGVLGRPTHEQNGWLRDEARRVMENLVKITDTYARSIR
jgi:sulfofructosephosphate aldolase